MKHKVLIAAAALLTMAGSAYAQGGPPGGGGGGFQMPPELTKAFEKMRTARKNRMQVGQMLRAMTELNKDPKTALTKDQATKVMGVINTWKAKPDMSEDQAKQVSKQLTAPLSTNVGQLKKLTVAMQSRGRMGGGGGGGRMGGGGGGGFGGGRPGGGGPPGGGGAGGQQFDPKAIARRIDDSLKKPYNPLNPATFGDGPFVQRMKDGLANTIKDIQARAK